MSTQLFAEQYHLDFLSSLGDNLEKLDKAVNWKIFLPKIDESLKGISKNCFYKDFIGFFE